MIEQLAIPLVMRLNHLVPYVGVSLSNFVGGRRGLLGRGRKIYVGLSQWFSILRNHWSSDFEFTAPSHDRACTSGLIPPPQHGLNQFETSRLWSLYGQILRWCNSPTQNFLSVEESIQAIIRPSDSTYFTNDTHTLLERIFLFCLIGRIVRYVFWCYWIIKLCEYYIVVGYVWQYQIQYCIIALRFGVVNMKSLQNKFDLLTSPHLISSVKLLKVQEMQCCNID